MTTSRDQPYLRFERRFDVPPETVFDTLTDPDPRRIWWGDDAEFDINLGVGGQWKIIRREGGEEYLATGNYLKVERPSQLQYTFAMSQFSPNSDTITIQIEEDNGGSFVTFEQSGDDIALRNCETCHRATRPLVKQAGSKDLTLWSRHGRSPPNDVCSRRGGVVNRFRRLAAQRDC